MIAKLFWLSIAAIVYTYAGYPALLGLLARLRPKQRPAAGSATLPSLTLIITAYNEEAVIVRKLENSLSLDYPGQKLQIIVAADGSEDRTADIVRKYAGRDVELSYSPPRRGKMAAINRAMPLARGEIVVFSDANNMYRPDALRELVAPFSDPRVGAVTGAKSIIKDGDALGQSEGLYWKYESYIKEQESRLGCCTGAAGEIMAIRRDLFEPPPDGIINDDFYMALRLAQRGYDVVYNARAVSTERVSGSARDEMTRRARIVAGRYQAMAHAHRLVPWQRPLVAWQVISHKFMRPLVPVAMLGALLSNLAGVIRPARPAGSRFARLAPPFNWLLLAAQVVFYGLAWAGGYVERDSRRGKLLYLPAFLVNSNLAALAGLYRFLSGRQTVLWQRVPRRQEQPLMVVPAARIEPAVQLEC